MAKGVNSMNIVVLGSTGMAGHMVARYIEKQGNTVYRISRSEKESLYSRAIDVLETSAILKYIDSINADILINCIGLLQKECEARPDLAIYINSYFPHLLEEHFKNSPTKIIHLSTDCVFSGLSGNYVETDTPDGKTIYDRSKALGEINNNKDLTFRMSIIGPDLDPKGTGLFNWFMQQTGAINGYSNVIWNGITTLELAEAITAAIHTNLAGIYQLVPDDTISKYQLLLLIKNVFGKDITINKDSSFTVNKTLKNTRTDFEYRVKSYSEQVHNLKIWIEEYRDLYPQFYYTY